MDGQGQLQIDVFEAGLRAADHHFLTLLRHLSRNSAARMDIVIASVLRDPEGSIDLLLYVRDIHAAVLDRIESELDQRYRVAN